MISKRSRRLDATRLQHGWVLIHAAKRMQEPAKRKQAFVELWVAFGFALAAAWRVLG
jgi:hypothetical protein